MNGRIRTARMTLLELVIVIVVVAVLFVLFVGFPQPSREKARRVNCAGNLTQIGLSLLMYSGDSDGYFPMENHNDATNFEPLVRLSYMRDGKVWACPSRAEVLTTGRNSAYRYIGLGLKDDNTAAKSMSMAYDESGNHPSNAWANVLFIDGHVEGAMPGAQPWAWND